MLRVETPGRVADVDRVSVNPAASEQLRSMSVLGLFLLSIGMGPAAALGEVTADDPHKAPPRTRRTSLLPLNANRRRRRLFCSNV
ncbi:MAG: hypothetical protein P0120_04920 [Nitrospira sp.]|nr:hypothetical protein [Nitrospira sp.]